MEPDPPVIPDYHAPASYDDDTDTAAIPALVLCAPGAACFLLAPFGPPPAGLLLVAIITALISAAAYFRRLTQPKPWYILLNLGINIAGLLLTGAALLHK